MSGALRLLIAAFIILALDVARASDTRIFHGDIAHPVETGEVWIVANAWGANPAVLVATIQNGALVERQHVTLPLNWQAAFDYRLVVGAGVLRPWSPATQNAGYPAFEGRFTAVYLSPGIGDKGVAGHWRAALKLVARGEGGALVLPLPQKRAIRLLYPDGKPLANEPIADIALYASDQNHCGYPVGISLKPAATAVFRTNANGQVTVIATDGDLVIRHRLYVESSGGPAGAAFEVRDHVRLGRGQPTARALWTLPEYDYAMGFRTPEGLVLSRIRLDACLWRIACGAGCGQLVPANWDDAELRFRAHDLRVMGQITAIDHTGRERKLTASEMRDLLKSHHATIVWK